jgi:pyruvate dehydrogenase E1 component alpha subunit
VEYALSTRDLADRAAAFAMPAFVVDGQDVFAVYDAMGSAVRRARQGDGPTFLECKTYRYYGHFLGDDPHRYRTEEEETYYRGRDCIQRFLDAAALPADELERLQEAVDDRIDAAVRFAEQSPLPDPSDLTSEVYA